MTEQVACKFVGFSMGQRNKDTLLLSIASLVLIFLTSTLTTTALPTNTLAGRILPVSFDLAILRS